MNANAAVTLNKGIDMKTTVFLLVSALLLAGCSQNEDPVVAETEEATAASEAPAPQSDSTAAASETSASATQTTEPEGGAPSAAPTEAGASSESSVATSESSAATSDGQQSPAPATFISATVNKKAPIRAEASSSGDTVATLDKGASITVGSRSGIWYAAQSPTEGWIKITDVTIPNNGDGSSALAGLVSGRMGSGNSVASSGARGLDGDAVVTGKPDFEAVKELSALQDSGDSLGADFFKDQGERDIANDDESN